MILFYLLLTHDYIHIYFFDLKHLTDLRVIASLVCINRSHFFFISSRLLFVLDDCLYPLNRLTFKLIIFYLCYFVLFQVIRVLIFPGGLLKFKSPESKNKARRPQVVMSNYNFNLWY